MQVTVLHESGYAEALLGLSLSYNSTTTRSATISKGLSKKDSGHNKFLESITVWLDVTAPRFWWQEADTYRVGSSKQSESTMHTLTRGIITQFDFEYPISESYLTYLNTLVKAGNLLGLKNALPEGFLQRRIWVLNYKSLRTIINQRYTHKLPQWHYFIIHVLQQVAHPEYLQVKSDKKRDAEKQKPISGGYATSSHQTQEKMS